MTSQPLNGWFMFVDPVKNLKSPDLSVKFGFSYIQVTDPMISLMSGNQNEEYLIVVQT